MSPEFSGKTQILPRHSRESWSLDVPGMTLDSRFHGNNADLSHVLKANGFNYFHEGN
jgi:hypothetical protein